MFSSFTGTGASEFTFAVLVEATDTTFATLKVNNDLHDVTVPFTYGYDRRVRSLGPR